MRRAPVDASSPKTTSLNLLGIECGHIAQVSLNAMTRMQAKAIMRELHKRERKMSSWNITNDQSDQSGQGEG